MRWNSEALGGATALAAEHGSTALLVRQGSEIVTEWYGMPSTPPPACHVLDDGRTREDLASAQKSVTSLLVGIALGRGLLELDAPVTTFLGDGWSRADASVERRITLRHLLSMTSGLDDTLTSIAEPGTAWAYNLGAAYHSVKRVVAAAAGQDLGALSRTWLFDPLGLIETGWEARPVPAGATDAQRVFACYPDGEPFEALHSTARDLATLGAALLRNGQVVDDVVGTAPGYLAEALRSSSPLNPAYGLLWWVNGQPWHLRPRLPDRVDGWLSPQAPPDMIAALGAFGRCCYLVPSLDLVVVRLGADPGDRPLAPSRFGDDLWAQLGAAMHEEGR